MGLLGLLFANGDAGDHCSGDPGTRRRARGGQIAEPAFRGFDDPLVFDVPGDGEDDVRGHVLVGEVAIHGA